MRNKEKQRIYLRKWYRETIEERKAYRKKYYDSHKEQYRLLALRKKPYLQAYQKKWWERNKEKVLDNKFIERRNRRLKIIKFLGSKCIHCSVSDIRVLQFDHINGKGGQERINIGPGNHQLFQWKLFDKNPKDFCARYQLLCANCNWIKRIEKQEQKTRKVGNYVK